jgi:hypothetical protein
MLKGTLQLKLRKICVSHIQRDSSKQRSDNRHILLPHPVQFTIYNSLHNSNCIIGTATLCFTLE